jgi:peptide/nickel transport system permease protein
MIPSLFGITVLTFAVSRMVPGGPIAQVQATLQLESGRQLTDFQQEQMTRLLGLDRPLVEQYFVWLKRAAVLDFGYSFAHQGVEVRSQLFSAIQVSLALQTAAALLIYLLAVPIGVLAAVRQGSWFDHLVTGGLFLLYSIPNFFLASVLILVFASGRVFEWFPLMGMESLRSDELGFLESVFDRLHHLVLPVICLTYGGLASVSRFARAGMLEVIRQDYVRTARAKGLPEKLVIARHALRNGIIPIATLIATLFPYLLGGSVIVETIFNLPGMGLLTYEAVVSRDYPVVMATTTVIGVATLLGYLLSDLLYVLFDPRIELS